MSKRRSGPTGARIKSGSFLALHERLLKNGLGEYNATPNGLCSEMFVPHGERLGDHEVFRLFFPTLEDEQELINRGLNHAWWGSDDQDSLRAVYTSLRQTIVLLCAAISGEL